MKSLMMTLMFVFMAACGGGDSDKKSSTTKTPTTTAKKAKKAKAKKTKAKKNNSVAVDDGSVVTVSLTGNDMMQYNTGEITIAAGRTVKLTLEHVGKMNATMMGHNFVLLAQGTDVGAFTKAGMVAKATDYIAPAMKDQVIAKTKLLGGGQSDTIEFKAPAPGVYDFICTFPGHSMMMKGKLIVTGKGGKAGKAGKGGKKGGKKAGKKGGKKGKKNRK